MTPSIAASIRAVLIADPSVSAMVGDRIYPQTAPQGAAMPAVVYTVRRDPLQHQQGPQGLSQYGLGLDCWSRARPGVAPYDEANALAEAVVRCLGGYRGTSLGLQISSVIVGGVYDDGADEETGIYSVGVDVSVWAQPA